MGFNRNMAYAICEGPYNLGGAAIMSLVDIQDIGKMLEIAYAWAQRQTGWNTPILDDVMTALPRFEARQLRSLQNYLKRLMLLLKCTRIHHILCNDMGMYI
eukprot:7253510-Ditylum_brightwellii.AAC.1